MTNYRIIVSVHDGPPFLRPSGRCLPEIAGCHIDAPFLLGYSFKIWLVIGLSMNIRLGDLRGGTIKLVLTIMGLNFALHMKNLYFFAVQFI
jgi:hypothetical protein